MGDQPLLAPFEHRVAMLEDDLRQVAEALLEDGMELGERPLRLDVDEEEPALPGDERIDQLHDKAPRRLVDLMDAAQIEDQIVGLGGELVDAPQKPLGRAEEEAAL